MRPTIPDMTLEVWILFTILMYWRLDARRASLIALIAGWAFLPTGDYPEAVLQAGRELSGPTHAVGLPTSPPFNKATAIGLGCLVGTVLFDWPNLRRLRFRWFDAPMVVWLLAPIGSAVSNGHPIAEGLAQARHLTLAWGVPYGIGRARFADNEALGMFVRAWVAAGLATLPFALAEFIAGPFWYRVVYGGHPYRFDGSDRALGHRPLVFLEHGNQWGMWAVTSAVAAAWLWARGDLRTWSVGRFRVPGAVVVVSLVGSAVLWQSHGSLVLMALAILPLLVGGRWVKRARWWIGGGLVVLPLVLLAGLTIRGGGLGGIRDPLRSIFHGIGKSSFTWRFARIAENLPGMRERPVLGWGRADWSRLTADGSFTDPIALSLPFLVTGMFGLVGLLGLLGLLLTPLLAPLRAPGRPFVATAAVLLAVNVADLTLNSGFLLPILLAAGGLNGFLRDRSR